MKQSCPNCKTIAEINEKEYQPGEVVTRKCELCGEELVFNIPVPEVVKPKVVIVEKGPSDEEKKKKEKRDKALQDEIKELKEAQAKVDAQHQRDKEESKHITRIILVVVGILAVVGGIIGVVAWYNNVYIPNKIDEESPRYYTFATNVTLRSEPLAGADYTKITSLPFGTELITYDHGDEWCRVKVNMADANGERKTGYVASPYVLNKADFMLLSSIFGDNECKKVISESRCRLALLLYFKSKGLVGDMSQAEANEYGLNVNVMPQNHWQVFSKDRKQKNNTTYFKRLYDKESKFTDFAVIIKNINSGERKLLYFYFDDDESPHFYAEMPAPTTGYIKKITMEYGNLDVVYTD